ncbi:TetR/AcrR family transcriptional regulator [Mycolicibacterium moriokaense]|uniref:TetR family transcriptional regulator n=1 Tax=Mycolicibacterium moriokaense TaxID=39691 RepID=A0A318HND6_9MYCO|nr:TetR/AcrR family transcriptional regulator [Mycolicibacterium moriokaense]PXX12962.1 TetR family transcriptional regulator [Mycolicibacterium moriokaense]
MATRSETAAATRQSLLEAACALLDAGGPEAVTLREVGARTGVSRSAPYRHFADKDALLTALATNAVRELGDTLEVLASSDDPPGQCLRAALLSLVTIGRAKPHLYRLMFTTPAGDPTAAVQAAERTWDLFIDIVGRVVGPEHARHYGALLLTNAHGIASFEGSGHLVYDKWQITAEELIDMVVSLLPAAP